MRDIDADRYVASLKELDATVAMINTSGIVASYPTTLPFHTQSAYLRVTASTRSSTRATRAGIKVIARTDFSKVRPELHERHPEWASGGPTARRRGRRRRAVCPPAATSRSARLGSSRRRSRSSTSTGSTSTWPGSRPATTAASTTGSATARRAPRGSARCSASTLPESRTIRRMPTYRRYLVFQERTIGASKRRMDALDPAAPTRPRDRPAIGRGAEGSSGRSRTPRSTARLPEWPYCASANTKWVIGSLPRTVSSNSSVDFVDYPVRHVSVSPDRQRLRLAQSLANGGGLDYYVIGRLDRRHDRPALDAVRELFALPRRARG